jgi:peptidoglycan/LPS O-acetylase OafA/YrhL
MSQWEFYKRRLIWLQPMVIMGSLIGALLFYFQAGPEFSLIAATPVWKLILVMLIGFALIPVGNILDIRGWGEMYPLNGPAWSLFFEYIANVLYAGGIRKLPNRVLGVLVLLAAAFLVEVAVTSPRGGLIGGWSLDPQELRIGFARVLFPFFAGILLRRTGKYVQTKHAFAVCSFVLVGALALPRLGDPQRLWVNGVYESICVVLIFPLAVAMGAGDKRVDGVSIRIARFFGDLSYPLYITHYPLIYLYTSWIAREKVPVSLGAPVGALVLTASIAIAYGCLKLYDLPVRAWLSRRVLMTGSKGLGSDGSEKSQISASR